MRDSEAAKVVWSGRWNVSASSEPVPCLCSLLEVVALAKFHFDFPKVVGFRAVEIDPANSTAKASSLRDLETFQELWGSERYGQGQLKQSASNLSQVHGGANWCASVGKPCPHCRRILAEYASALQDFLRLPWS